MGQNGIWVIRNENENLMDLRKGFPEELFDFLSEGINEIIQKD